MRRRMTRDRPDGPEDLIIGIIVQAVKDALRGDREALDFLLGDGAEIAAAQGIASARRVRAWASNPLYPENFTICQLSRVSGMTINEIDCAIQRGDIECWYDGHAIRIPKREAERWMISGE